MKNIFETLSQHSSALIVRFYLVEVGGCCNYEFGYPSGFVWEETLRKVNHRPLYFLKRLLNGGWLRGPKMVWTFSFGHLDAADDLIYNAYVPSFFLLKDLAYPKKFHWTVTNGGVST